MRLIDADALTEFLKCLLPERGMWEIEGDTVKNAVCETVAEAIEMVKNMETIHPEPQWIPVSERLPEESGYYIATTHDGVGRRTTFVKYQKKAKSWELTGARSYWRVIAWMPLPEAYKPNK